MRRRIWGGLGTAVLAILLSVIVWVNAIYQNDRPREDFFPESFSVQVLNAPAGLVAVNNPTQLVRVRMRAFASAWDTLSSADFDVTADWGGLGAGTHSVPVKVSCSNRTVTIVSIHPQSIFVRLEPLQEITQTLTVDLRDQDALPLGYAIGTPVVEPSVVKLSGAASAVSSVARVIVPVSVMNQRALIERSVEPLALDESNYPVSGLTIAPSSVDVKVAIEKRENYREVAIRVRTKGQPERGYFVSSVTVLPASVTVVGPPSEVEKLGSLVDVRGELDVTGATRMLAAKMGLDLPAGLSVVGEREDQPFEVLVTVGIDPVTGGTTVELPLKARKVPEGLVAQMSMRTVDVILTGPAVLLDQLQTDLLEAYVDLNGLGPGTHQLKPSVEVLAPQDSELRALVVKDILPQLVDVVLVVPTPTPIPTATPTVTPSATPTNTPRPRLTPTIDATRRTPAP